MYCDYLSRIFIVAVLVTGLSNSFLDIQHLADAITQSDLPSFEHFRVKGLAQKLYSENWHLGLKPVTF